MNCFEARQDFIAFWKKELEPERRTALVRHLSECPKCDAAFRTFALTAPVLHSDGEPARPAVVARPMHTSAMRRGAVYRERRSGPWLSMVAAVVLFFAGAFAAYFSVAVQPPTLADAVIQPEPFVELVSADMPEADSDFGQ